MSVVPDWRLHKVVGGKMNLYNWARHCSKLSRKSKNQTVEIRSKQKSEKQLTTSKCSACLCNDKKNNVDATTAKKAPEKFLTSE